MALEDILKRQDVPEDIKDEIRRNISEHKRGEKLTEALYKLSQAVYSTDNLKELFQHIHQVLSGIIQAKNFFIALLSDDGKILFYPYGRDEKDPDDWQDIKADDSGSLTVEVLRTKKPLLLNEKELNDVIQAVGIEYGGLHQSAGWEFR